MLNVSTRKVGGIRFVKIGRLTLAFCISRAYRPMKDVTPRKPARPALPALGMAALSLALSGASPLSPGAHAADWRTEFVLVGHGCEGATAPLYRDVEDEFPPCRAIERVSLDEVPACDLARLLPTDGNIEACTGRPWHE